jgi:hypothetical protein
LSGPSRRDYFAGAGTGVGCVTAVFAAFLFFFTCFLVVVAGVELLACAGVWAAWAPNDNPAEARVREIPRTADVSVFMVVKSNSFSEAFSYFRLRNE